MNIKSIGFLLASLGVGIIFPNLVNSLTISSAHQNILPSCPHRSCILSRLTPKEINPSFSPAQTLIFTLSQYYFAHKPLGNIVPNLTLEEGYLIQDGFVQVLASRLGKPVGYKVGLTNINAQKAFQVNHPVKGILLEKMLLKNGAKVKVNFGAIPRLEGDLIVRVGSDNINQAKTPQEVINALDAVIPFIELPDLMYQRNVKLTASKLVAVNAGARLGVMGKPIALTNKKEWTKQLSQLKIIIKDNTGKELATGKSDSLLGDPISVVIWLRDELKSEGKTLKKGDLISLGSMTSFLLVQSGQKIIAQYWGLEDNQPVEITVNFID